MEVCDRGRWIVVQWLSMGICFRTCKNTNREKERQMSAHHRRRNWSVTKCDQGEKARKRERENLPVIG